jgi:hypothetical protein
LIATWKGCFTFMVVGASPSTLLKNNYQDSVGSLLIFSDDRQLQPIRFGFDDGRQW